MNKQEILNIIIRHCKALKMKPDKKGYVKTYEENLIQIFDNWKEIKKELGEGQGGELIPDKKGLIKFNAVHSSSALGVNNFATFKKDHQNFKFLNYSDFTEISFEKKLSTRISTPNLDFYIETKYEIIGFESKFTEYLSPKFPNYDKNLDKYLHHSKLDYLPKSYHDDLIKHYVNSPNKLHLDVAQLIKHGIGIIHKAQSKYNFMLNALITQPVLVYIYWQPSNWYNFEIFRKHADEIEEFRKLVQPFLTFISLSYLDFWKAYENDRLFGAHIEKVKERYLIELK